MHSFALFDALTSGNALMGSALASPVVFKSGGGVILRNMCVTLLP